MNKKIVVRPTNRNLGAARPTPLKRTKEDSTRSRQPPADGRRAIFNFPPAKFLPPEKNRQSCDTFAINVLGNVQVARGKRFVRSFVVYCNLHEYQNRKLPPSWRNETPFLSTFPIMAHDVNVQNRQKVIIVL